MGISLEQRYPHYPRFDSEGTITLSDVMQIHLKLFFRQSFFVAVICLFFLTGEQYVCLPIYDSPALHHHNLYLLCLHMAAVLLQPEH